MIVLCRSMNEREALCHEGACPQSTGHDRFLFRLIVLKIYETIWKKWSFYKKYNFTNCESFLRWVWCVIFRIWFQRDKLMSCGDISTWSGFVEIFVITPQILVNDTYSSVISGIFWNICVEKWHKELDLAWESLGFKHSRCISIRF